MTICSFNNLYFQLETLRLGTQSISLDDYDIVLCYRDDMVLSSKTDLSLEFSRAKEHYVTSLFEWHDGVFERFYACNPSLFRLMIHKDHYIYDDFSCRSTRLRSYKYTGERLAYKVIKDTHARIWPIQVYTYRIRIGPYIACESNRVRIQDFPSLLPHLIRNKLSSLV